MIFNDLKNGRFYNEDCFDAMKEIPDGVIDIILCDLPYGTTQNKWDSVLPLDKLWAEYWRVAKPNAAIVLTAQTPFDKLLGMSQIDFLKYEWIWEKTEASGHLNAKIQPMKAHENILVFYKEQCNYFPQKIKAKAVKIVQKSANGSSNYGEQLPTTYESDERYPRSVQLISKDNKNKKIHSTQKPVTLFEYLLKTYTNENELVLDNTAGSGTTAIAAINTNRKWVCIEKDKEYYDKALARITWHEKPSYP